MNRFSGYIEGYYGRMLSWGERRLLCDRLGSLSLNTYVYAPKEDPFHRVRWRAPYQATWAKEFLSFTRHASKKNVRVVPCVAPGLSFDYTSRADYSALLEKFSFFAGLGCRAVGLLMDDIPPVVPKKSRNTFSSLGQAHGLLLQCLLADIRKRRSGVTMWFCPTIYTDQLAPEGIENCAYLKDLCASIPGDVQVMWTGPSVISKKLDRVSIGPVSRMFKGNIVIWDNLYANDYCPSRLFAGPYTGRSRNVYDVAQGMLINPTGMPHTDSLLLGILAAFNEKKSSTTGWREAARESGVDKKFPSVAQFFLPPNTPNRREAPTKQAIARYRKALHHLVWEWKSPLQREWYPFLYTLDADLSLLEKPRSTPETQAWIEKKYPPVLSAILCGGKRPGR
jgi:hypothetical protein